MGMLRKKKMGMQKLIQTMKEMRKQREREKKSKMPFENLREKVMVNYSKKLSGSLRKKVMVNYSKKLSGSLRKRTREKVNYSMKTQNLLV